MVASVNLRHVGAALMALVFAAGTHSAAGLTGWVDVCKEETFKRFRKTLCPDVFFVSTLAFNPLYPGITSEVALFLQPSKQLSSRQEKVQFVYIKMPGFTPVGEVNEFDQYAIDLTVTGNNLVPIGVEPSKAYNNPGNPLFKSPAQFDTMTNTIKMQMHIGKDLLADIDTEIRFCCLRLPMNSPKDDPMYRIWAPTNLGIDDVSYHSILEAPILSTPLIDPGYQWEFIQVTFDPPVSRALTQIGLTFRAANDLGDRRRIILHVPGVVREDGGTGPIDFNTQGSPSETDWMFFAHEALWNATEEVLVFYLRKGAMLPKGRTVTVRTYPGVFRLPTRFAPNWPGLTLECRSFDYPGDEVIRAAPVSQSSWVPHIRNFTMSELKYELQQPEVMTHVHLTFRTNRPMFAGTSIFLRLAGFRADRIEIPLFGDTKFFFLRHMGVFDLPSNIMELKVNKTIYSDEENITVYMSNLILPPALYVDDPSLLIKPSDEGAPWQSIQTSPEICTKAERIAGSKCKAKEFERAQILFEPMQSRMPANITFFIKPTIFFYQGDQIVLHLYGFVSNDELIYFRGADASRFVGGYGRWNADESVLVLVIDTNQIVSNTATLELNIPLEANFRLPDKLSKNDGILRIEGVGALIYKERFKKTPQFGDEKYVISSRLEFSPIPPPRGNGQLAMEIARISISFILNTNALPNSSVYVKLGGITRDIPGSSVKDGPVLLSGANAPLFVGGIGMWDQFENTLEVTVIKEVQIYSGEKIRFFIEIDQYFRLPFATYPNDPSFMLRIPEAGIEDSVFHYSNRVSQADKQFVVGSMSYCYGGETVDCTAVAYPNTGVELRLYFQANVVIPAGSVIRLELPGFMSPVKRMKLASPPITLIGESDLSQVVPYADWDQLAYTLDLHIPRGKFVTRSEPSVLRLMEPDNAIRLPTFPLEPNDPRLKIGVIQNQIIHMTSIFDSPRVVDRSFIVSEFEYLPAQAESIFMLRMKLEPTVNITEDQPIIISLPGFINVLSKFNIHITGPNRSMIRDSMGQWNASEQTLTLKAPVGQRICAFCLMELQVEESQGFILPPSLNANDSRVTVSSYRNINPQKVKKSPMVGDGPNAGHRFCMYQHERGTSTEQVICPTALTSTPPLTDPCNNEELERTGCSLRSLELLPIRIRGFNLQLTDTVSFLPVAQLCGSADLGVFSSFSLPQNVSVSADRGMIFYEGISSIDTGYFRICMNHEGRIFDVGQVVVRPSCAKPLVMVDGVCVAHCPKSKIPIAGNCRRDPVASEDWDSQALMLQVRMDDPNVASAAIADSSSDDPERKYFIYRFTYELAGLLNCDPTRIKVASLSNGSIIVNAVFETVVGASDGVKITTDERSAMGLISLLKALQGDTSSIMYESSFFKYIDRSFSPPPFYVRPCPDGVYRIFCPYDGSIISNGGSMLIFLLAALGVLAVLCLCCGAAWMGDKRKDDDGVDNVILDKCRRDPNLVGPKIQLEYANSWLEGRFMNEIWEQKRALRKLPIGN
eukprot:TRINITY_DN20070_c0_g1_i1.p1 TRINITY_DN20070_c0_g1~~TRINITY_DN20070_c0_g1_i1.p1  ORF type:complete len:1612 (+),score=301.09 TRINITY_DN20070_c0_g1_i1:309-4838(+)